MYIIGWSVLDRKNGLNSDASWSKSMKEVSIMKTTDCFHMMSAIPSNTLERKQYWDRLLGDTNALCDSGQFSLMSDFVLFQTSYPVEAQRWKERSLLLLIALLQNMPVLKQYGTYRITTCLIAIMHCCCFTFLESVRSVVF